MGKLGVEVGQRLFQLSCVPIIPAGFELAEDAGPGKQEQIPFSQILVLGGRPLLFRPLGFFRFEELDLTLDGLALPSSRHDSIITFESHPRR